VEQLHKYFFHFHIAKVTNLRKWALLGELFYVAEVQVLIVQIGLDFLKDCFIGLFSEAHFQNCQGQSSQVGVGVCSQTFDFFDEHVLHLLRKISPIELFEDLYATIR
jgi:hypothetical protein